jgi:hypothetical protein
MGRKPQNTTKMQKEEFSTRNFCKPSNEASGRTKEVTYSKRKKIALCDTTADSDQHSAHSSSLTVELCSRAVAVRHQQKRASKMIFTLHEYCDTCLILGACDNRAYAAVRAYAERYPAHRHPDSNAFRRLDERTRKTGNVLHNTTIR